MAEPNTAGSAPAEVEDVFQGRDVSLNEYMKFRESGDRPAEQADPAPADSSEETTSEVDETETAGESETPQTQEPPAKKTQTAAQRIAKLRSTIDKLWEQEEPDTIKIAQLDATIDRIEQNAGLKRKTEPAPVTQQQQTQQTEPKAQSTSQQQQPQNYEQWLDSFDEQKWQSEWHAKNPDKSFERGVLALTEYVSDVRRQFETVAAQRQAQQQEFAQKVNEARERYDNFDEVVKPVAAKLEQTPLPGAVQAMINDSEVFPDLLFVIGSKEGELASFLEMAQKQPGKALRYIALTENLIREEQAKASANATKSGEKAPEKKTTNAPKPPTPVTGGSSRTFDVNDENIPEEEWFRKRNADVTRKRGLR